MMLRAASLSLILWGLVNAIGGSLGARGHPAPWVALLFPPIGGLIVLAGIGFWLNRQWAVWIGLVGLAALSGLALTSGYILRGPAGMNISHHLTRLAISAALFALAVVGLRSGRRHGSRPEDPIRQRAS